MQSAPPFLIRPNRLGLSRYRYGEKTLEESAARADELAAQDDYNGQAVWCRITEAVSQLANMPPGALH